MNRRGLRNPWWVVFGAVLGMAVSNGPIMSFSFGVLIKPIASSLHWTRADVTAGLAISGFTSALSSPILGRLMDRFGVRPVTMLCVLLFGLCVASVGLMPVSLDSFILLYAIMGAISSGIAPLPYAKSIAASFDARRGLALGVAIAGVGIGVALVPQYVLFLLGTVGWRGAYVGLGLLHVAIAFPAVVIFLREPVPARRRSTAIAPTLPGMGLREAMAGGRAFWLIAFAFIFSATALIGITTHIVPILTDAGISASYATSVLSVSGIALVVGRMSSGWLVDKIFAPIVTAIFFLLPLLGVALLGLGAGGAVPFVGAFLLGMGIGGELDIMAFLISRYFGLRAFGLIYGLMTGLYFLAAHVGPYLIDVVYGMAHGYGWSLIAAATLLAVACVLVLCLGSYRFPAGSDRTEAEPWRAGEAREVDHAI